MNQDCRFGLLSWYWFDWFPSKYCCIYQIHVSDLNQICGFAHVGPIKLSECGATTSHHPGSCIKALVMIGCGGLFAHCCSSFNNLGTEQRVVTSYMGVYIDNGASGQFHKSISHDGLWLFMWHYLINVSDEQLQHVERAPAIILQFFLFGCLFPFSPIRSSPTTKIFFFCKVIVLLLIHVTLTQVVVKERLSNIRLVLNTWGLSEKVDFSQNFPLYFTPLFRPFLWREVWGWTSVPGT